MNGVVTWFFSVFAPQSVALTVLVISVVAATGLALGSLKFKGLSLGIPGVMFTGLIGARLLEKLHPGGATLNKEVIAFVRDFGLIIFVYAVGVQVGPGFLASLRKRGLPLNLMAVGIVLLGAVLSIGLAYGTGTDLRAAVGLFAGATTNAPAFGSASEALKTVHGKEVGMEASEMVAGPAFAIAYPFGLMGVILAMVVLRAVFKVDPQQDGEAIEALEKSSRTELATLNIALKNPNLHGIALGKLPMLDRSSVVVSRIKHAAEVRIARPEMVVELGDVLLAVGPAEELNSLRLVVGEVSDVDLRELGNAITTRPILVTHREVLGKSVDEVGLARRLGVTMTRVQRTGMEFSAAGELRLQFGDRVTAVGEPGALDEAARVLGDSVRELNHPRLLPIFFGIMLGVFLGSLPVFVPGLPAPVKLGLASGPMIVAIILARVGRIGPLIWYMPNNASSMLKELGIALFLIAVGLLAGDGFFDTLRKPIGLELLWQGAVVTIVPLLVVGWMARVIFKVRYLHVCGLLAGSMTSPSLAYTGTMTTSEAPNVAFATVYPLTMILRVLMAQLLVLVFCGAAPGTGTSGAGTQTVAMGK